MTSTTHGAVKLLTGTHAGQCQHVRVIKPVMYRRHLVCTAVRGMAVGGAVPE